MILQNVKEINKSRYVLLDTNLLIKLYKISDLEEFKEFFFFLNDKNLTPLITESVYFEFIRNAHTKSQKKDRKEYLKDITEGDPIPEGEEIKNKAIELGNVYANKKVLGSPSSIDCFIGANIIQYKDKIVLATCDLDDYSTKVFNINGLFVIFPENNNQGISNQIIKIGFFSFDEDKFKNSLNDFEKS